MNEDPEKSETYAGARRVLKDLEQQLLRTDDAPLRFVLRELVRCACLPARIA